MDLKELQGLVPEDCFKVLSKEGIETLRPSQSKAIKAGLLDGKSILVCTPTASGKTLTAELAACQHIMNGKFQGTESPEKTSFSGGKVIYIVPLVALAYEKYKEFKRKYEGLFKVALSIGDYDSSDSFLIDYDFIICTSEKLDSLIRHKTPWLKYTSLLIIDEIHLLNDVSRGPTLEVLLTLMKKLMPKIQIVGLSATIGNPKELADWLEAGLVEDDWRPVPLKKGVYHDGSINFDV